MDWWGRWASSDIALVEIDGEEESVCPDCHAELLSTGQVRET